ncbi:MAG TPA: NAD(+) synthase [Lachnospiraceae bacterium]|nr:NAD(+) synthase [Lachnospiraceae bacterium]
MEQGFVKVAALTPKIKVADPKYNSEQIKLKLTEAYEKKAKIIVFPELCITGYTCGDLFLQELLVEEALEQLKLLAYFTKEHDSLVFVGLPFEKEGKLYNVAAALQDGKILGIIPKMHIPTYAEFYEGRYFSPGEKNVSKVYIDHKEIPFGCNIVFKADNVKGLVIGCEICEDLWVPDPPSTAHALVGATVIVNLSASNETIGKDVYREMLVKSASARLLAAYIYTSAGEGESTQDLVFGGHNIIAENGTVLAQAKRFACENLYSDIDVGRISMERRRMSSFYTVLKHEYQVVSFQLTCEETKLDRTFGCMPFVPTDPTERDKRCNEILSIQSYGLKKRYEHTGCKKAVVGVSGGLDSTLALLVTVRTFDMLNLPRENILAITMPCFGTTNRTYENACRLSKTLGCSLREINIKEAVTMHFRDIDQNMEEHDVTFENGQARERTQILMDVANKENGLVIGTGDMSELALGFATYNGDHMSMYGVNAGVPKTLVRHLVHYYADTCENRKLEEILLDVLDTPVSPELLPPVNGVISQCTEELIGPYELHDFFLYYMLRCGFAPAKLYRIAKASFEGQYTPEEILKWMKLFYRRFFSQQFKRSCLPDGPKVGSVAVSPRGDLRMPSDASAALWMEQVENLSV